ncbi:MAG TPA: hypothetical protein VD735_04115 [Candidatus Saccharimonadales bacterium]|nr:hypothetical protein [Candidatus Saccharimonadales bacterium]
MSGNPNDWLYDGIPLQFHERGFDVTHGMPSVSARFEPAGYLSLTGEGYGVVLRAGTHIGHAALYAAAVSHTGGVPVYMQCYQGRFTAQAQEFSPHLPLKSDEVTAIHARFDTIDTMGIELASGVSLEPDDRLLIGTVALQMMQEFAVACGIQPRGKRV